MIVYLIRHADRLKEEKSPKSPITEKGVAQAEAVSKRVSKLNIDVIYSSSFTRALQTAEIISKELNKPIEVWDHLIESDSDVETFEHLNERAEEILKHLISHHKDQKILCVSHASMIEKIVAKMVFGDDLTSKMVEDIRLHFGTDNTGISVCEYREDFGWLLRSYNDSSHL
jgi:broad specificity phosphatase PhoE